MPRRKLSAAFVARTTVRRIAMRVAMAYQAF
jgi:hypothetical protein